VRIPMIFSTSSPEGRINLAVMDSLTKERALRVFLFDGYNESANPVSSPIFTFPS